MIPKKKREDRILTKCSLISISEISLNMVKAMIFKSIQTKRTEIDMWSTENPLWAGQCQNNLIRVIWLLIYLFVLFSDPFCPILCSSFMK